MDFEILNRTKLMFISDVTGRTWHGPAPTVEENAIMAQHTITIDLAGAIDAEWVNAGSPPDGLRLVDMRTAGNGYRTYLEVPGDDSAPYYMRQNGGFVHIAGPTLAEWYAEQEYADERETMRDLLQF